jgi:pyrroline-5-carboxylate reductase
VAASKLVFIGAGNMASSIIGGLVAKGYPAQSITASDPHEGTLERLKAIAPVRTASDNCKAIADADVVILAVKPQVMKDVLAPIAATLRESRPLIISIAAGIGIRSIEAWLGDATLPIVRCMPNTPALVQAGATGLYAGASVSAGQRAQADTILRAIGIALWVEREADIDAVTAVSGSGPAYFFMVMEAMQAAGEKLGLAPDVARQLTLQTALGAAQMAIASDVDAAELRRRVTSPNGTTERAIAAFEAGGLRALFEKGMTDCRDRSIELAKELGA